MSSDPVSNTQLPLLNRLVGAWTTEATHPMMPGVVVHGTVMVEWFEGEKFLLHRAHTDHPDFPDALSVIGDMGHDRADAEAPAASDSSLRMHYFDSRGVFRVCETSISDDAWSWWRIVDGFSQRFTGQFADGGDTIVGLCQLRRDNVHWKDDLAITYRRRKA